MSEFLIKYIPLDFVDVYLMLCSGQLSIKIVIIKKSQDVCHDI